ncbi:helix-turn-helix domain-containing protein [Flavobacterium sp. CGRL2]
MKNKVKILREEKNMTQNELAEKSGLSLRTIQRIEAGNILKGFTLKTIAQSLETEPENLIATKENSEIERAKLINLSALSGFIIPFGSIIFPLILTYKTKDFKNRELGKQIISIQIFLSLILFVFNDLESVHSKSIFYRISSFSGSVNCNSLLKISCCYIKRN